MRDLISNIQVVHLGKLTLSGTTPGLTSYVDVRGFNACTLVVSRDTITNAGNTIDGITFALQESDDDTGAGATAVVDAETVGGSATLNLIGNGQNGTIEGGLGYLGGKRYVGVSATGSTVNVDAVVNVYAVLGRPHEAPTTFAGTGVART